MKKKFYSHSWTLVMVNVAGEEEKVWGDASTQQLAERACLAKRRFGERNGWKHVASVVASVEN